MIRSPVQARAGHTALPNELLARALAELTPEQFRLLVGLFYEAEFKREGATTPDGRWRVGFGQVLASLGGLADRYSLTVDAVRWALRRFRDLGVTSGPAARPDEPTNQPAPENTAGSTMRHTNRPTIIDLRDWAGFLGERGDNTKRNATRDTGPSTNQPAPIQHGNTGTPNTEKLSLVAEAPASGEAAAFERVVEVWKRVCVPAGFADARSTAQQRKAARARLREPGWFEAFSAACAYVAVEPFYRGGSSSGWVLTLGWLLKPGNAEKTAERATTRKALPALPPGKRHGMVPMATPQGRARDIASGRAPWDLDTPPGASPPAEWAAVLAMHEELPPDEQRRGIRDLHVQVRNGALVLRARDRFEAALLRDTWAPGISKLAEKALGRRVAVLVDDPERNLQVGPAPPAPREAWGGGGDVDLGTGEKRPLGVAGGQGT